MFETEIFCTVQNFHKTVKFRRFVTIDGYMGLSIKFCKCHFQALYICFILFKKYISLFFDCNNNIFESSIPFAELFGRSTGMIPFAMNVEVVKTIAKRTKTTSIKGMTFIESNFFIKSCHQFFYISKKYIVKYHCHNCYNKPRCRGF